MGACLENKRLLHEAATSDRERQGKRSAEQKRGITGLPRKLSGWATGSPSGRSRSRSRVLSQNLKAGRRHRDKLNTETETEAREGAGQHPHRVQPPPQALSPLHEQAAGRHVAVQIVPRRQRHAQRHRRGAALGALAVPVEQVGELQGGGGGGGGDGQQSAPPAKRRSSEAAAETKRRKSRRRRPQHSSSTAAAAAAACSSTQAPRRLPHGGSPCLLHVAGAVAAPLLHSKVGQGARYVVVQHSSLVRHLCGGGAKGRRTY